MFQKPCLLVVAFLACCQLGGRAADEPAPASNPMEGTWQLVSAKNGDETEFTPAPADSKRLKVINRSHFVWMALDPANGTVTAMGGGSYTFKADTYTERLDFGLDLGDLFGKDQVFKVTFKGDTYEQAGTLSNGFKIDEIWKRVKK